MLMMRMGSTTDHTKAYRIIGEKPSRRRIEYNVVIIESILPREFPGVNDTVVPDHLYMISDLGFQVMSKEVNPCGQRSRLFWTAAEGALHVEQVAIELTLASKIR
jgi:hypothetical protein